VSKARVFVSFDFDNDRPLKDFIVGQSRLPDSPFEIVDMSLKEAAPTPTWERKARDAIKRSDLVLVMVGRQAWRAPGVLKEVRMARQENIRIVQMIGYSDLTNPTRVPNAGTLYRWSWPTLKKTFADAAATADKRRRVAAIRRILARRRGGGHEQR